MHVHIAKNREHLHWVFIFDIAGADADGKRAGRKDSGFVFVRKRALLDATDRKDPQELVETGANITTAIKTKNAHKNRPLIIRPSNVLTLKKLRAKLRQDQGLIRQTGLRRVLPVLNRQPMAAQVRGAQVPYQHDCRQDIVGKDFAKNLGPG